MKPNLEKVRIIHPKFVSLHYPYRSIMYVSVGSSCNVCIENTPKRAAILRYRPESGQDKIFATDLRNTARFDWHPVTKALYGLDNGHDLLGDNFLPCELNEIKQGQFYG